MSRRTIEGSYARLRGLRDSSITASPALPRSFGEDYSDVLSNLRDDIDDDFSGFDIKEHFYFDKSDNIYTYERSSLISKINQLIAYLEMVHRASDRIIEIGSAFNLIKDPELKSRCSDLLSASGHFDRVLNQATQVLEERIRSRCPELGSDVGLSLVGKAIGNNPLKTRLRFSLIASEQEGYAALLRGVVGAFRNPSHHRFLENITREQSLQVCAFIDNMLSAIEGAEIVE